MAFFSALILAMLLASTPAIAQIDTPLQQARALMVANNPQAAYALLAPLEAAQAQSAEFNYLLGIAALDSGHVTRALFALERVLALQPNNALARAEIGRAYLAAGEVDAARAQLEQVRASPIPKDVKPTVDRFLGAISQLQAQNETQWRGYVESGFGYNTNVNGATADSQVAVPALGGLLFNIDPASRQTKDAFGFLGAGGSVRVPIAPDLAFAGNFTSGRDFNGDNNDRFDSAVFDSSAGFSKTIGGSVFSGALQAASNRIGGNSFRDAFGVLGQWQYNLGSQAQTTVFIQSSRLSYPNDTIRDADRRVVGAGYARAFAAGPVIYVSVYGGSEDATANNVPFLSHRLAGLRAGFQWQTAERVTLFGNMNFEDRHYGGEEPLFNQARHDRQQNISAGLNYMIARGWRLTPQVAYTDNGSNIPIYKFDRVVSSLILRREF